MKSLVIICVAILVAGCGGIDLSTPDETRLTGDYHYLWDYDKDPPELQIGRRTSKSGYSILIGNVIAYGWTNDVIIAKCRPGNATNGNSYAILKVNTGQPGESVFKDLSHDDYLRKRKELTLSDDLTFTRDYE